MRIKENENCEIEHGTFSNDERLKRLDPVVIFSSGIIPGNPKYLLLRGADSCALAHNIILSKDQVINLRNTLSKYHYEWDKS